MLVLSDLHVEEAPFDPPAFDGEVVVLAGDIANGPASIRWARAAFPRPRIVQIAGNHEFYDGEVFATLDAMRAAAREEGVDFLENGEVVVDGVRFVGCTLWTDFRLFEAPGRPLAHSRDDAMTACGARVPDFRVIRIRDGAGTRAFTPADSAALHDASRRWLARALDVAFAGPTVVVTHHLPSWRSVHPMHARWVTSASFASDADDLLGRSACWVHGHTHTSWRYPAGTTRVICNPRGYPGGALRRMGLRRPAPGAGADAGTPAAPADDTFENPAFEPALVVDVGTDGGGRAFG